MPDRVKLFVVLGMKMFADVELFGQLATHKFGPFDSSNCGGGERGHAGRLTHTYASDDFQIYSWWNTLTRCFDWSTHMVR